MTRADDEMMHALEADGAKLFQLTGEDHGPYFWLDCPECGGEGGYERHCLTYEDGCGFPHDDGYWVECEACRGRGGMICEAEGDR